MCGYRSVLNSWVTSPASLTFTVDHTRNGDLLMYTTLYILSSMRHSGTLWHKYAPVFCNIRCAQILSKQANEKETACIFNECCCLCPSGPVVYVLDLADRLISKAGPFAAAGIMVGSIYWTAVTYGAVTVMQVWPEIPFVTGRFILVKVVTLTVPVHWLIKSQCTEKQFCNSGTYFYWSFLSRERNKKVKVILLKCRLHYKSSHSCPSHPNIVFVLLYCSFLGFFLKVNPFPSSAVALHGNVPSALQVVGHKEGLDVMERADPLFLLIGLPTIPVMLILGKMIRWEDYVLRLWRKYSNKLQILNSILPGQDTHTRTHTEF